MAHLLSLLQDAVNVKASIGDFQKNVIETDPESARQFGTLVWILAGGEAGELFFCFGLFWDGLRAEEVE